MIWSNKSKLKDVWGNTCTILSYCHGKMTSKRSVWFSLIGLKLTTADLLSHIIKPDSIASRES